MRFGFVIFLCLFFAQSTAQALELQSESGASPGLKVYSITSAITLPQPLSVGVTLSHPDFQNWKGFIEGGYFKYPISESSRSFSALSIQSGLRYFPFQDSGWYVFSSLGFRELGVKVDLSNLKSDGVSLASSARLKLRALFLGAGFGGIFELNSWLSLGFDVGVQLSLIGGGSVTIDPSAEADSQTDLSVEADQALARLSSLPVPTIGLLRFEFRL